MGKGENITTEVLGKICGALNCSLDDIMEFIPDEPKEAKWDDHAELLHHVRWYRCGEVGERRANRAEWHPSSAVSQARS